jgi:tRNA pseudouridine38-40 synthase
MNSKRYLINLAFLGFRFHGVQKQKGFLSVHEVIEGSLKKASTLPPFKLRFSSRTDTKVSALETFCLAIFDEAAAKNSIQEAMISFLPADIECRDVIAVDDQFTIIKASAWKEYHYYFSFGKERNHPFSAPFMTHIYEELNIESMKKGAALFTGTHNFINYAYRPKDNSLKTREVFESEIGENHVFKASFFPEKSYVFKVKAPSFMRGQMRIMMGALFRVGQGEMSLLELENSLREQDSGFVKWQAPATGLILHSTKLK